MRTLVIEEEILMYIGQKDMHVLPKHAWSKNSTHRANMVNVP